MVTRFGASRGDILPYRIHRGNAARRVWRIFATRFIALRIHWAKEGECKQYVFDPTTPSGGLWYKLKQVWNGKWRRHAKGRKKDREAGSSREKGVARVSSFRASNWNNGNWLTSNEYSIGLPTFEQWEKNIRRRTTDVDRRSYNEGYVCNLHDAFPFPSSDSLGNTRENGARGRRGLGNRAGILTFIRFSPMILEDKSD